MVFAYHASIVFPLLPSGMLRNAVEGGLTGVGVFFVLSGIVMVLSQLRVNDQVPDWAGFWRKRAARVLPTYYAALAASLPIWFLYARTPVSDPTPLQLAGVVLGSVTLTQTWVPWMVFEGMGQAWSLNVELFFYLLFPGLALIMSRLSARGVIIALVIVLILIGVISETNALQPWTLPWVTAYSHPVFRLPEFLLGMLTGRLILTRPLPERPARILVVLAALVFAWMLGSTGLGRMSVPALQPVLVPLIAIGLYGLCYAPGGLPARTLRSRVMQWLGRVSYALYLWHSAALLVVERAWGMTGWPAVLLALSVSLLLANASHRWVEVPAQRWLTRSRKSGTDVPHVTGGVIQNASDGAPRAARG